MKIFGNVVGNVAVTIDEDRRRREQFEDIMANAKPLSVVGKGRSQRVLTATATVPLSCCFVDTRYQGMRNHNHINRLINRWDERKLSPIVLVPHLDDYVFAIADGQGRAKAAKIKGIERLSAIILMDAPDDPDERLRFEAEYFINQDSEVETVKPMEKHLARVIIGDETAVALDKLLTKYNIKFVTTKGNREGSILGSYTDTYAIVKTHGEKCLDFIFSIIANAGWDKEYNGYATFIMRALKEIWAAYPKERKEIHTYLSKELRKISPNLFSSKARTKYPTRDHRMACILYMEDIVCDGLGMEKKIYIDGQKRYKVLK